MRHIIRLTSNVALTDSLPVEVLTFDTYRGVVVYVRVVDGAIKAGDMVRLMATNSSYEVKEVGIFRPQLPKFVPQEELGPGDVGYVIANMKTVTEVKVGDTLTGTRQPATEPLSGFQELQVKPL